MTQKKTQVAWPEEDRGFWMVKIIVCFLVLAVWYCFYCLSSRANTTPPTAHTSMLDNRTSFLGGINHLTHSTHEALLLTST